MRDPVVPQFWKYARHITVKTWSADDRVRLVRGHAPAEDDPRAVGRGPEIINHLAGVAGDPIPGKQPVDQIARQRLGRDDVAADRNDPPPQPWQQRAAIPVRRRDNIPCTHHSPRGRDLEPLAHPFDMRHLASANRLNTRTARGLKKTAVIAPRIERGMTRKDHAAMIDIGTQFRALIGTRHRMGFYSLLAGQLFGFPYQVFIAFGGMRGMKAPNPAKIAIDPFRLDTVLDPFERIGPFLPDGTGTLDPVFCRQLGQ